MGSVRPELVCEVAYDYLQGNRFRHASTFLRWRDDKKPEDCRFDQLEPDAQRYGVRMPTLPDPTSANHTLPSGPTAMPSGWAFSWGWETRGSRPSRGSSLPIALPFSSENHTVPSRATAMPADRRRRWGS